MVEAFSVLSQKTCSWSTARSKKVSLFKAGRLQYYIENWRKITSDVNILDIVQHCHFEFDEDFSVVNFMFFKVENLLNLNQLLLIMKFLAFWL